MRNLVLALLVALSPVSAHAEDPDCGNNGGFFGREFRPQYDRRDREPTFVEVADPDVTCRADAMRSYRQELGRFLECADPERQVDGVHYFVFISHNAPAWLKAHGACHIWYGAWHD